MCVYIAKLDAELLDLRGDTTLAAPHLDPAGYANGQPLGAAARMGEHYSLTYPSVRDQEGGESAAVFRLPALRPTRHGKHFEYRWDGQRITAVVELRERSYSPGAYRHVSGWLIRGNDAPYSTSAETHVSTGKTLAASSR